MRRSIIVLLISLLVFGLTLILTNQYVTDCAIDIAAEKNNITVTNFCTDFDGDMQATIQSANSFLAGNFYIKETKLGFDNNSYEYFIDNYEINKFQTYAFAILRGFLRINPYFHSAMFVVDSSIYPEYSERGYAPAAGSKDTVGVDLAPMYDFMHSRSFLKSKNDRRIRWSLPSVESPLYHECVTLYIPLQCMDGRFFGEFAINISIDLIKEKMLKHLPYEPDQCAYYLISQEDSIVISSTHDKFVPSDTIADPDKKILYYNTLEHAPWEIIASCDKDAVFSNATRVQHIIYIVSGIGMLLMLLCCIIISRQIRGNLLQKATAEQEIRLAAKVQMQMLKRPKFSSPGSNLSAYIRPARTAGGDLYDYVMKDGKLIFCIGDVAGKGVPASLLMAQIISLFRNVVVRTSEPNAIAAEISRVIASNNPDMTFCTFFVGVLAGEELTFCNAGHNPPILCHRTSTGCEASLISVIPNLALGLSGNYPYRSQTLPLPEDTCLLLYTDGVTEAKNTAHKQFGTQHLLDVITETSTDPAKISQESIIRHVIHSVETFVRGADQSDDITILTVGC